MEIFDSNLFQEKNVVSLYHTPKLDAESGSSLQNIVELLVSVTFVLDWLTLNLRTLHPGAKSDSNAIGSNLEM